MIQVHVGLIAAPAVWPPPDLQQRITLSHVPVSLKRVLAYVTASGTRGILICLRTRFRRECDSHQAQHSGHCGVCVQYMQRFTVNIKPKSFNSSEKQTHLPDVHPTGGLVCPVRGFIHQTASNDWCKILMLKPRLLLSKHVSQSEASSTQYETLSV